MTERTSRKVASKAAKVLRDPKSSKRAKSVAASALTQRETGLQYDVYAALLRMYQELRAVLGFTKPKKRKPPLRAKKING